MKKSTTAQPAAKKTREASVGKMLKILSFSLDGEMHQELKQLGLNLSQFAVLMTLLEEEGLSQAAIGKKIIMPGYSTTRNIDALEEKQLLERRKDERSRRSHRIYLTDQGHALCPQLVAIVKKVNEALLSTLLPTEEKQLKAILKKLFCARLGL